MQSNRYFTLPILILLWTIASPVTVPAQESGQLEITVTTTIVADAVKAVGGEKVVINTLIGPGIDPHDFEPKPSDVVNINESDYIFWIGGGAEESLEDLLEFWEKLGKSTPLIEAVNSTDLISGGEDHQDEYEEDHGLYDPHFWMDPVLWKQAVIKIGEDLSQLAPDLSSSFDTNKEAYIDQLNQLHNTTMDEVARLDSSQKFLVTHHNSMSYYIQRYGFEGKSLQGISTESETGINEIDALAQYLVDNDIEVVFTESTTPSEDIQAVIDSARARGHSVVIGGQLLVGSLGTEDNQDTYIEMMTYNTQTIVSAIINPPEQTQNSLPVSPLWSIALVVSILVRRRLQSSIQE